MVVFSKVFTSVEGNWGSVHLNRSLGVNEWDDTVDTLGDKSCFFKICMQACTEKVNNSYSEATKFSPVSQ